MKTETRKKMLEALTKDELIEYVIELENLKNSNWMTNIMASPITKPNMETTISNYMLV